MQAPVLRREEEASVSSFPPWWRVLCVLRNPESASRRSPFKSAPSLGAEGDVMKRSVCGMLAIAAVLVSVSTAPLFGAGAKEKSLYDRLGGKKAITAVVDEFVGRVAGDGRINASTRSTWAHPTRLKRSTR